MLFLLKFTILRLVDTTILCSLTILVFSLTQRLNLKVMNRRNSLRFGLMINTLTCQENFRLLTLSLAEYSLTLKEPSSSRAEEQPGFICSQD